MTYSTDITRILDNSGYEARGTGRTRHQLDCLENSSIYVVASNTARQLCQNYLNTKPRAARNVTFIICTNVQDLVFRLKGNRLPVSIDHYAKRRMLQHTLSRLDEIEGSNGIK